MDGVALLSYLPAAFVLGSGLTAIKLLKTGLFRKYTAFCASLIVPIPLFVASVLPVSLHLSTNSKHYFYLWEATQPVEWFCYITMVFEIYRLILARHRGLYTVGQWAMYAGLAISVTLSALTLLPRITQASPQGSTWMPYLTAGERGVDCSLAIFLLFMMFLLSWYAVPLSRNVVVHAVVCTVFLLTNALRLVLYNIFGMKNMDELNTAMTAVSCVCILAWFFLLTPGGEEVRIKQPWIGAEREERILSQLDSINAALLKTARK
jgi:hypothetical protein